MQIRKNGNLSNLIIRAQFLLCRLNNSDSLKLYESFRRQTLIYHSFFFNADPLTLAKFGLPTVVAINRFPTDTEKEISKVQEVCKDSGVNAILAEHWAHGGKGAQKLAESVVQIIDNNIIGLKIIFSGR